MKILVVQDHLRSGGTERQALLLTHGFADAGHAARLLTFRPGGALAAGAAGLDWWALQPFDTRCDGFAPGLVRTARAFAPDVILCLGREANRRAGRLLRELPDAVVVATLRTGRALPAAFRRALREVPHVVANSRAAAAGLTRDHGVPAERISVIPNGLVFPPGAARNDASRGSDGGGRGDAGWGDGRGARAGDSGGGDEHTGDELGGDERRVGGGNERGRDGRSLGQRHSASPRARPVALLCVAMCRPGKGHAELIEALARLPADAPPWELRIVGDGVTRPAVERLAAARGLADRVRWLGWVADPGPHYAAADLAVLASRTESLPNFLIEAQAHGLPVVAADVMGVGECFLPGETGALVPLDDPEAFAAAVRGYLDDPARRAAHGRRGAAWARERFDPARACGSYLELFSRLRTEHAAQRT